MSDISRPGVRAARAVAEYAAFYGAGTSPERVRELVADGIAEVRAYLDEAVIMTEALDMLTDPNR